MIDGSLTAPEITLDANHRGVAARSLAAYPRRVVSILLVVAMFLFVTWAADNQQVLK